MPTHSAADTSSALSFLIFICNLLFKSRTHSRKCSRVRGGGSRLPQQGGKLFRRDLCGSHHLVDLGGLSS